MHDTPNECILTSMRTRLVAIAAVIALAGCSHAAAASRAEATAAAIVAKLQAAGLPMTNVVIYNADTDENHLLGRPGQYVTKANWDDTRDPHQGTYTVETFASAHDRDARARSVKGITTSSSLFGQYIYTAGMAVMRIDYHVTAVDASVYNAAFIAASQS